VDSSIIATEEISITASKIKVPEFYNNLGGRRRQTFLFSGIFVYLDT
jgi:hypothetical protein